MINQCYKDMIMGTNVDYWTDMVVFQQIDRHLVQIFTYESDFMHWKVGYGVPF